MAFPFFKFDTICVFLLFWKTYLLNYNYHILSIFNFYNEQTQFWFRGLLLEDFLCWTFFTVKVRDGLMWNDVWLLGSYTHKISCMASKVTIGIVYLYQLLGSVFIFSKMLSQVSSIRFNKRCTKLKGGRRFFKISKIQSLLSCIIWLIWGHRQQTCNPYIEGQKHRFSKRNGLWKCRRKV